MEAEEDAFADRRRACGRLESFNCPGGGRRDPVETKATPLATPIQPPCFVQPGSLYDGKRFVVPKRGSAPKVDKPGKTNGTSPAVDPNPGDPTR